MPKNPLSCVTTAWAHTRYGNQGCIDHFIDVGRRGGYFPTVLSSSLSLLRNGQRAPTFVFPSTMGFAKMHVVHALKNRQSQNTKRATTPNASCYTGGFYKSPSNGATVDSLQPLDITWDNTCLDTANADIYVLAPGSRTLSPHVWNDIPFAAGKYTLQLQPRWWNDSATQSLQISIVPANSPLGLNGNSLLPAGPVITATYHAPANGKIPEIADLSSNTQAGVSSDLKGIARPLAPGKTAAAVLFPLLIVIGLIFAYFRYQRKRTNEQTKRFSQALDKRMSTIATDWKSMSPAGATAAIRSSMAIGNRDSSAFAFGNIRPTSTASEVESGQAGVGTGQMTQVRTGTGVGLRNPAAAVAIAAERASRVSRVSFAAGDHPRTSQAASRASLADSRPSTDSSRRTRAFHQGHVPPVPTLRTDVVSSVLSVYPDSEIEAPEDRIVASAYDEKKALGNTRGSPTLSPRQTQGPLTLTPEDIRARMEGREEENMRQEMDEVLPALSSTFRILQLIISSHLKPFFQK